jgi:hypothetical protein
MDGDTSVGQDCMIGYQILFDFLSPAERKELLSYINEIKWDKPQDFGYLKQEVLKGRFDLLIKRSALVLGSEDQTIDDCYAIRYPDRSYVPPHTDPTPAGMEHWRINAIIQSSESGGIFGIEGRNVDLLEGDAVIFRADKLIHRIGTIYGSTERLVWSAGILKKGKSNESDEEIDNG